MDNNQQNLNVTLDMKFGIMLQGEYNKGDTNITAYLAYNDTTLKYYFETNIGSKYIVLFRDIEDITLFYNTNAARIKEIGDAVFPDREHTEYEAIEYKPTIEELQSLSNGGDPHDIKKFKTWFLYIKLYDNSPYVNDFYFITEQDNEGTVEVITTKNFNESLIFENKDEANKYYLDHEEEIKTLAEEMKTGQLFNHCDVGICGSAVIPRRDFILDSNPPRPTPPTPPIPPVPPVPPYPPKPPYPPYPPKPPYPPYPPKPVYSSNTDLPSFLKSSKKKPFYSN